MTEDEQRAHWKTVPIVAIYLQTEHVRFSRAPRRDYSRVFRDQRFADYGRSMHRTQPRRNRLDGGRCRRCPTIAKGYLIQAAWRALADNCPVSRFDIAAAVSKLAARVLVLDGEVAIYDQQLRSRFDWLREPDADAVATPPVFMAFDLLHQDGRELTGRP